MLEGLHQLEAAHQELILFTEKEFARGAKVSVSLARKLRRNGQGPRFVRVGKCVRYLLEDVQRWLAEQRRTPTAKALPVPQK